MEVDQAATCHVKVQLQSAPTPCFWRLCMWKMMEVGKLSSAMCKRQLQFGHNTGDTLFVGLMQHPAQRCQAALLREHF
jgi:hypothetical protein